MLNNHYDSLVLGKSYISFLLSIVCLQQGDSVLLLDDSRISYGKSWYLHIGDMDRRLIKLWGEKYNINSFRNIDDYLSPSTVELRLKDKSILVGDSPYRNLREFMRKFTDCFSDDLLEKFSALNERDFNTRFERLLQDIVTAAFESSDFRSIDGLMLMNDSDEFITFLSSLIDCYAKGVEEGEVSSVYNSLVQLLQSIYQTTLGRNVSTLVLRYLLLQSLSHNYAVDEISLNRDLFAEFKQLGGDFKKTQVESWQIYKNCLSNVLLYSYEGVIGAKQTYYMGSLPSEIPFRVSSPKEIYSTIRFKIDHPREIFAKYVGRRMVLSGPSGIGSDFPMLQIYFPYPNQCYIDYLYVKHDGGKISFYIEDIKKEIVGYFSNIFWEFGGAEILQHISAEEGQNYWMKSDGNFNSNRLRFAYSKLLDASRPKVGESVENLLYLGPDNANPMGAYAFLIDLKRRMNWS